MLTLYTPRSEENIGICYHLHGTGCRAKDFKARSVIVINIIHFIMTSVNAANRCLVDSVDAHLVVAVTGEEGGAVSGPGQRQALRVWRVLAHVDKLGRKLVNDRLAFQVKDLDAAGGGSAEPVTGRAEDKSVDHIAGLERVEVLAVRQLPQHCDTVLAARGAQRAVRRNGDGVDVTGVSEVVGLQLAL